MKHRTLTVLVWTVVLITLMSGLNLTQVSGSTTSSGADATVTQTSQELSCPIGNGSINYHLATEALLSLGSSYQDSTWLTVGLGMLTYVILFFTLGYSTNDQGGSYINPSTSLLTLLLTIWIVAGLIWHFRKQYLTRSRDLRIKIGDIRAAIAREQGIFPTSDQDESGLGTILKIWTEMPTWARYRRRNFYQRNLLVSVIMAGMLLVAYQASHFGIWGGGVSLGLITGMIALYIWTKVSNGRDDQRMLVDWNAKVEALTATIDPKLQEL